MLTFHNIRNSIQGLSLLKGKLVFSFHNFRKLDCRLLDPDLESSGSLFVGSYILQLILHLQSQMVPHIRDLVAALVRRMQSAQIAGLKSSLLLIFARLVCCEFPLSGLIYTSVIWHTHFLL